MVLRRHVARRGERRARATRYQDKANDGREDGAEREEDGERGDEVLLPRGQVLEEERTVRRH